MHTVSKNLTSLIVAQICQTREMKRIFQELLREEGSEIYVCPAKNYIVTEQKTSIYTACEAAARQREVLISYRTVNPDTGEVEIITNPPKSREIVFGGDDSLTTVCLSSGWTNVRLNGTPCIPDTLSDTIFSPKGNGTCHMEYTIREMIAQKGRTLTETDYAHSNSDMLDFRLFSGDFYEWNGGKLRFKQCADVMDFEQTAAAFPPFGNVTYKSREKFPYFTGGLDVLLEAMKRGETVAVEGGPCLFGEYEVSVTLHLQGGQTRMFDYAGGKAYLQMENADDDGEEDFSETESLADYLRENGAHVEHITFQNHKPGLTPQEYVNLRYPFEIAAALGEPLVIPIPDMSYRKFLLAVLDYVPEGIRARTLADFDAISAQIRQYYLDAIRELREQFPVERFLCVHGGCREEVAAWYEKRSPYIERGKVLRSLTRLPEKIEPIKDYISMPALPFYFFGATNLLQVDSVDETDSYRKCKKAHKNALRMGCILIPELLSGDGVHTLYNAPLQWKDYGNAGRENQEETV